MTMTFSNLTSATNAQQIKNITIHCSATTDKQDLTVSDIDRMHRQRGFLKVGYHYVIRRDGTIDTGRLENQVGAHVEGHNKGNIGVCWIGGINSKTKKAEDNRTQAQKDALVKLVTDLRTRYPEAQVRGHRDWSPDLNKDGKIQKNEWMKECPCFDAMLEYNWR